MMFRCFFAHRWSQWTKSDEKASFWTLRYQFRNCKRCGLIQRKSL